uniref:Uncharacterized protein n=1 Tax=Panagrolaimus superbus TaxID=310955 RepID=A0A914Z3K0_9BILA
MSSSKERLLKHIDDILIGLDTQFQDLYNVFETFISTKTGKSCLIVGQELSGKTSLIEAVYKKFPRDFEEQNIVNIDGHFCDDSEGTNLMGNQTQDSKLVIVDNFEQFAVRSRQQLLYTIMNQACLSNCLVLFCSRDANCTDAFEKRVRSRFSQKKIFLNPEDHLPIERLHKLLVPSTWKFKSKQSHEQWKTFCNEICSKKDYIAREMERVVSYGHGPSIFKLKQIALLLASKYFDNLPEDTEIAVTNISSMIAPKSTEILDYLTTLETQEIFILEIMRRLTDRNGIREIPYLNIFQSFSNVHHSLKARPPRKEIVYFMLEKMVEKKIIELKEGTHKGQLDFRPVHVTVSGDTIKAAWEKKSKRTFLADAFIATMNLQL